MAELSFLNRIEVWVARDDHVGAIANALNEYINYRWIEIYSLDPSCIARLKQCTSLGNFVAIYSSVSQLAVCLPVKQKYIRSNRILGTRYGNTDVLYHMVNKRILTPFRRKYLSLRVAELRREVKLKCIEYKGGKCEKCGYNRCPPAMHFHHLNPSEKDFSISNKSF